MRAVTTAIALALATSPAHADDAAAKALFDQGKTLFAEGKYGEACAKLEASFKLSALSSTRGLLGACYEKVGKLASAWAAYRDAAAIADRQGHGERAQAAREKAAELEPQLAKLAIETSAIEGIANIEVTIDGVVQPAAALNQALPIDAGPHVVVADARGYKKWQTTVDILDGESQRTAVPMLEADPAELEAPTSSTKMSRRQLAGLGGIGVGGAAMLVGAAFGVVAKLDWDASGCTGDGACPSQDAKDKADAAGRNADIATVVGLSGLVVAAAGAVIYFTAPRQSETTVMPVASPHGVSLLLEGRF